MKITALTPRDKHEKRVAITPDLAKKYRAIKLDVCIEAGAGQAAGYSDAAYVDAGAEVKSELADCLAGTDILLTVEALTAEVIQALPEGVSIVGALSPNILEASLPELAAKKIKPYALELLPRISRAQSMDILSSQSNLAGYRAVIEGFAASQKVAPMMMTSAGTVVPAKVLVLGAGVAGLQAIATAKRLGAVVSAFDVRTAVKEQVESLGGKFIEVAPSENASGETTGGYAKEMDEDYKKRQAQAIFDAIVKQDIVVTTALIPGKPAPELITKAMVEGMAQGSVIVDMAAIAGGNCKLTKADKIIEKQGVTLIGHTNLPSHAAGDASALFAKNIYTFITTLLIKDGALAPDMEDELVSATWVQSA